jgi:hypothetical protein
LFGEVFDTEVFLKTGEEGTGMLEVIKDDYVIEEDGFDDHFRVWF